MSILARIPLAGFLLLPLAASAQSKPSVQSTILGTWTGTAISHGQQVPLELHLSGSPQSPTATLINGPEITPASSATFSGHHLLITFNDFARTIDATLRPDHKLTGSFGTTKIRYPPHPHSGKSPRIPLRQYPARHPRRLGDRRRHPERRVRLAAPRRSGSSPRPRRHPARRRRHRQPLRHMGSARPWPDRSLPYLPCLPLLRRLTRPLHPHPAARRNPPCLQPPARRPDHQPPAEPRRPPPRRRPRRPPRAAYRSYPANPHEGP